MAKIPGDSRRGGLLIVNSSDFVKPWLFYKIQPSGRIPAQNRGCGGGVITTGLFIKLLPGTPKTIENAYGSHIFWKSRTRT